MTTIRPTVLDVSRAVAQLSDIKPSHLRVLDVSYPQDSVKTFQSMLRAARVRVASNLAFQFARHYGAGGRKNVTARDVRFVLMSHGAGPGPQLDRDARAIAAIIRADFSDGWR